MPLLLMNHESFEGAKQVLACCILVRAWCYTSQGWRNLWYSGKKEKMTLALDVLFTWMCLTCANAWQCCWTELPSLLLVKVMQWDTCVCCWLHHLQGR